MGEKKWRDPALLKEEYWDNGKTAGEIGDEVGCSKRTVLNWMEKFEIPRREAGHRLDSPPTVYTGTNGYERVQSQTDGGLSVASIHRLVAVSWFGFHQINGKHIHHKNGVPWDNREDNLEPLEPEEHISIHSSGRDRSRDESGRFAEEGH